MSPTEPQRYTVLLENPMLPPYRLDFFKALSRSSSIAPTLSFGKSHPSTSLVDVEGGHGLALLPVRNLFVLGQAATVQFGLVGHLKSRRWDAMVASFDPRLVLNLVAMWVAKRQGTKFIWWGHGIRPRQRFQGLYRRMAMAADAVILYSAEGKRKLAALGVPEGKLFVAWNSINTEEIAALRSETWEGRNRLLTIGRLIPGKKIDLLLRAFASAIPNLPPDVRLTVVGEGPEEGSLRVLATSLGVSERVEWTGALYDQADLAPIFNSAFASVTAGMVGLNVVHSLAYGVPMIWPDVDAHGPEAEALRDGENGLVFPAGDACRLAGAIAELGSHSDCARKLGTHGARTAMRYFSVGSMVRVFEDAVTYACGGRA